MTYQLFCTINHKPIFPRLKHKNEKYDNIANVGNLRKTLLAGKLFLNFDR